MEKRQSWKLRWNDDGSYREYLQANGFREKVKGDVLSCFEHVYDKDGITCMDVYIHVDSVLKTDSFTNFS